VNILKQSTFSKLGFSYSCNTDIPATQFCYDYQMHSPTQWVNKKTVYLHSQRSDQRDPDPVYFLHLTDRGKAVAGIT